MLLPFIMAIALGIAGVRTPEPVANGDAPARAPALLSETGLYAAAGAIARENAPFSPQYPLWSDGASKARWVHLPAGTRIDVSDIDRWRFPAGTRFWKEFSWGGRKVETRMIWTPRAGEWIFAAYVWRDDQSDADLAPETGVPGVVEVARGKRHSIPSVADCKACHAESPAVVLGFTALQLSDDRDPLAPHAEPLPPGAVTLGSLIEALKVEPPRRDLVDRPPRIRSSDPNARAALGYLSANCGGCHNGVSPLARLEFDLLHDVAGDAGSPERALATAVGAPGRYEIPGVPAGGSRVVHPGRPDWSALLHRMRSRRPMSQMPPLGTVIPDTQAILVVERWIAGLRPSPVSVSSR